MEKTTKREGAAARRRLCRGSNSTSRGRNTADGLSRFALREVINYASAALQPLEMEPPFPARCTLTSRSYWLSFSPFNLKHYTSYDANPENIGTNLLTKNSGSNKKSRRKLSTFSFALQSGYSVGTLFAFLRLKERRRLLGEIQTTANPQRHRCSFSIS